MGGGGSSSSSQKDETRITETTTTSFGDIGVTGEQATEVLNRLAVTTENVTARNAESVDAGFEAGVQNVNAGFEALGTGFNALSDLNPKDDTEADGTRPTNRQPRQNVNAAPSSDGNDTNTLLTAAAIAGGVASAITVYRSMK